MNVYDRLKVPRRINASGTLTRLGGSLMAPEVLDAMREAAKSYVDIADLQAAASGVIAHHTGAEAGIVTSGASAALTLATAACLTGMDAASMDRLPDTDGMAREVVMCRHHRTGYDHAIRAAGARIHEVGFNDRTMGAGIRGVEQWEIEAVIGANTVAVAYSASTVEDPPLTEVIEVAHAHGLPVIVDAAAQLPPKTNLTYFIEQGADLVAFSGGKAIAGPQGTGILAGKRDLIAAAALQQLDMDVPAKNWTPPNSLIPQQTLKGLPHHGLGRGFKVSKEDIVGLIVALERFTSEDHDVLNEVRESLLRKLANRLTNISGLKIKLFSASETGRVPILELHIDKFITGIDAVSVSATLQADRQPINLGECKANQNVLLIDPMGLQDGDSEIIAKRLLSLLGKEV